MKVQLEIKLSEIRTAGAKLTSRSEYEKKEALETIIRAGEEAERLIAEIVEELTLEAEKYEPKSNQRRMILIDKANLERIRKGLRLDDMRRHLIVVNREIERMNRRLEEQRLLEESQRLQKPKPKIK